MDGIKGAKITGFGASLASPVKDARLLETVFVHRSFLNEPEGAGLESNERLEFLGDAVLSLMISRLLFEKFPGIAEGDLTRIRSRLVNKRTLSEIAAGLEMGDCLLLGRGEMLSSGKSNPTILAGAFEALIAAIFLDSGLKACESFATALFSPLIDSARLGTSHFDYKPRLQEITQRVFKSAPVYRQTGESGPSHKKVFVVEVEVNGGVLGKGSAAKKKDAEQEAAKEALIRLEQAYGGAK